MKMRSLKNMAILFTLAAITTTQAVQAHSSNSDSSAGFEFAVSPFDSYHLAHVSLNQIISDLNVAVLAEALPVTTTTVGSIPTAYNQDIVIAAQNLQNALIAIGGNQNAPIAFAFDSYAVAVEQLAAGTNTVQNLQNIAINTLAQALIELTPSLSTAKRTNKVNAYVQNITNVYAELIAADQAQNFTLAIAYNQQIYTYANDLMDYIVKRILKDDAK